MREELTRIEEQLKKIVEQHAARIFASTDVEEQLAEKLVNAMQEVIREDAEGNKTAPHIFTLNINPKFVQDVKANQQLFDRLSQSLLEVGLIEQITFNSPPSINVFPDEELADGEFEIKAMHTDIELKATHEIQPSKISPPENQIPPKAFLIVGGSKIFALEQEVVNIGRKLSNQLVIDDPRVSRHHGQLRAVKGRYMLFDIDSSGGTFVNGKRVPQAVLHPGDVISLAGVPMVYGQDAVRAISETQEYKRPDASARDSETTTVKINISKLDLDDFSD